jgi:hypothetical protein
MRDNLVVFYNLSVSKISPIKRDDLIRWGGLS